MENIYVLYHLNDIDSFASAWAIWNKFGADANYFSVGKKSRLPEELVGEVYVIQAPLSYKILKGITQEANKCILFYNDSNTDQEILDLEECEFDVNEALCRMVWEYLYSGKNLPDILRYIEDKVFFRFKLPNSKEINAAIDSYPYDFKTWRDLNDRINDDLLIEGQALIRAQSRYVEKVCRNPRTIIIDNIEIPIVNSGIHYKEIASRLARNNGNGIGACWYEISDGSRIYSLRSTGSIDVAEIAKKFGGNGHKTAAGFRTTEVLT